MSRETEYVRRRKVIVATSNTQLTRKDSGALVTNLGASGAVIVTLPTDAEVGDNFLFNVGAAQSLTIAHGQATNKFISGGAIQAADKDLVADDEAESITLTKVSSVAWLASGTVGTWTIET